MKRIRTTGTTNLSFNDMLFNILIGFVMLFILAFLLINPITKKADVPTKAEILLMLEWDDMSPSDMDLWIETETGAFVGFTQRQWNNWYLDKDDLGIANDTIVIDGVVSAVRVNGETITMRGIQPGKYYVAVHAYSMRESELDITLSLIDVNPYIESYSITKTFTSARQILRFPAFEVDKEGNVTRIFEHNRRVVPVKNAVSDPQIQGSSE